MLDKLLTEIRAGGTLEVTALASRLGASPRLVEAMLEHLQRAGHIRNYADCNDGCLGCGLRADCNKQNTVRLWQSKPEQ